MKTSAFCLIKDYYTHVFIKIFVISAQTFSFPKTNGLSLASSQVCFGHPILFLSLRDINMTFELSRFTRHLMGRHLVSVRPSLGLLLSRV